MTKVSAILWVSNEVDIYNDFAPDLFRLLTCLCQEKKGGSAVKVSEDPFVVPKKKRSSLSLYIYGYIHIYIHHQNKWRTFHINTTYPQKKVSIQNSMRPHFKIKKTQASEFPESPLTLCPLPCSHQPHQQEPSSATHFQLGYVHALRWMIRA